MQSCDPDKKRDNDYRFGFNGIVSSSDKIHTSVVPAEGNKPTENKAGIKLGSTMYLQKFGISQEPAIQVNIYGASINQAIKNYENPAMVADPNSPEGEMVRNNLDQDQQIGAVAGHEYEHATNPVDVSEVKENRTFSAKDPRHKAAYNKGTKIANEYGLNKTK